MIKLKILHSILNKDEKRLLVDIYLWGELVLTGDELITFKNDVEDILAHYQSEITAGNLIIDIISEQFEVGDITVTTTIGVNVTWVNTRNDHPKYVYWFERMAQDPNIEFKDEMIIEG